MKVKSFWALVTASVVLLFLMSCNVHRPKTSWEYSMITTYEPIPDYVPQPNWIDDFNMIGAEGWELVAVNSVPIQDGRSKTQYIFKRQVAR